MLARSVTATLAIGVLGLSACHQDNDEVLRKIDSISQRIDRLAAGAPAGNVAGAAAPGAMQPRPGPDPSRTYAVPTDDLPAIGRADAPVTIVKAYEYACPFCERARATEDQIRQKYGDKVRVVYAPFVVHPQVATLPMETACAAYKQGKFAAINDLLWEKAFKPHQFGQDNLDAIAREAGLDMARYAADEKGDCAAWVTKHQTVMSAFGVTGTPAFFINGRFLSGAQPLPAFETIIDDELKKAEDKIAHGTPAADYYATFVLGAGAKTL